MALLLRRALRHAAGCGEAVDYDGGADEGAEKTGGACEGGELGKIVFFVCFD